MSAGRVALIVLGSVVALLGLGLAAGGGFLLWADRTQREGGYLTTPTERLEALGAQRADLATLLDRA